MTDLYQLVPVKSVQEDEAAILQVLKDMRSGKLSSDLRLLNYYQEIPVSYPGTIEDVDGEMADLTVHQHQAVVMQYQKFAFLKSRHLQNDVVGRVFRADADKGIALLHKFAYAQIRAERRQFVRVQVMGALPVSFATPAGKVTGNMVDISVSGASFDAQQPEPAIETQMGGSLSFSLEGTPLQIEGTLLKISDIDGKTRYIFSLSPNSKTEEKISQFIFQRQLEIIRALKDGL